MPIEAFGAFSAVILAISLAAERVVTILKTIIPGLAEVQDTGLDPTQIAKKEKFRKLRVWGIAFIAAWLTAGWLVIEGHSFGTNSPNWMWNPFGSIAMGEKRAIPAFMAAFIASGGSALWSNVLGFTKEVEDAQKEVVKANKAVTKTKEAEQRTAEYREKEQKGTLAEG